MPGALPVEVEGVRVGEDLRVPVRGEVGGVHRLTRTDDHPADLDVLRGDHRSRPRPTRREARGAREQARRAVSRRG
ncbi:hypothetical protein ADK34_12590 [Streptomyces viridochromogenes]|uniref:Uncharacterized protein n=1 Tax=Streptomyces viridochromogenes TaxID=1938 RepID=A0A0L8KWL8_STRVR|nr:hypothetical protein ADK34_12590 [Streptomyces viridochromogenes]